MMRCLQIKMVMAVGVLTLAFYAPTTVSAQWVPGPNADSYDHAIASTMNSMMLAERLALNSLGIDLRLAAAYRKQGQARIAAGRATTRFAPVAASLASHFAERAKTPQERQRLAREFERQLQAFQQQEKTRGVVRHDLAAALGLAFVLNYEVYSGGQKANAKQLAGITEDFRRALLKDAMLQGFSDREKQLLYEQSAIDTMAHVIGHEEGVRANDARKQNEAREGSKRFLDRWWDKPVEGLELTANGFADRAARVMSGGGATTRFQTVSAPIMPKVLAAKRQWGFRVGPSSLGTIEEQKMKYLAGQEKYFNWCLVRFGEHQRARGGAGNDLAFGQAVAVALNYEVYSGGHKLNDKQFAWVLSEMREDVLGSADWQRLSDREKQENYEQVAIEAVATLHYEQTLNPDPNSGDAYSRSALKRNAVNAARDRAKGNLKTLFAPRVFENYKLTETGFVTVR